MENYVILICLFFNLYILLPAQKIYVVILKLAKLCDQNVKNSNHCIKAVIVFMSRISVKKSYILKNILKNLERELKFFNELMLIYSFRDC